LELPVKIAMPSILIHRQPIYEFGLPSPDKPELKIED
jgi:hypothetical protein